MAPVLPATSTIGGAAAMGAGLGVMQPATSWSERGQNTALSGALGGAGQAGINALGRVISPQTSPQVKQLMAEGITPTPGQILGGGFRRVEDAATSVPLLGDAIKASQRRGIEDVNKAAFNRALKPIGEALPKELKGNEAVKYTYDKLGDAYESLLPKMKAQADDEFVQGITSLKNMVSEGAIDPNAVNAFNRILDGQVLGKFQGQDSMSGETLKNVQSTLRNEINRCKTLTNG
jgi:hypothetical protein